MEWKTVNGDAGESIKEPVEINLLFQGFLNLTESNPSGEDLMRC